MQLSENVLTNHQWIPPERTKLDRQGYRSVHSIAQENGIGWSKVVILMKVKAMED